MRFHAHLVVTLLAAVTALPVAAQRNQDPPADAWNDLAKRFDKNQDGVIDKAEYTRSGESFSRLDRNGDGVLTLNDLERRPNTRPSGRRRNDAGSEEGRPKVEVGKKAPDFELARVDDPKKKVKLSSFTGKKPVALIFGSYT